MEGDMKNKLLLDNLKVKKGFKGLKGLQYWIAAISYLIIFSLSILCLVFYLPHLSEADALDTATLNLLNAMLIIVLIVGTAAFGWEMLQWRKRRASESRSNIEDVIKNANKDSNNSR
jgi:phosphoglycerol transferase MdoB-like AlkP superfamily enzyme